MRGGCMPNSRSFAIRYYDSHYRSIRLQLDDGEGTFFSFFLFFSLSLFLCDFNEMIPGSRGLIFASRRKPDPLVGELASFLDCRQQGVISFASGEFQHRYVALRAFVFDLTIPHSVERIPRRIRVRIKGDG